MLIVSKHSHTIYNYVDSHNAINQFYRYIALLACIIHYINYTYAVYLSIEPSRTYNHAC
jgi:hypothetical protein